jgi:hypothetical protein
VNKKSIIFKKIGDLGRVGSNLLKLPQLSQWQVGAEILDLKEIRFFSRSDKFCSSLKKPSHYTF